MDQRTKKLLEIEKNLGGAKNDVDPLADLIFGETETSAAPSEPDEELILAPPVLSRAEQNQIERKLDADVAFFRLFGSFGDFDLDNGRMSPQFKAAIEEMEREEEEKFLGRAPKEKESVDDELVERVSASFAAWLEKRHRGAGRGPKEKLRRAFERAEANGMFDGIVSGRTLQFIKAYCANSTESMRRVARELARA